MMGALQQPVSSPAVVGSASGAELGGGRRVEALDALRGVAILLVIVHHVGLRFPLVDRGLAGSFVVDIGWAGVDLFFAISGYLITTILMRNASAGALQGFFIRRFFRIVPLYALAVGLFALASVWTGNDLAILNRIWINALFLTAWAIPFLGENGVPYTITWSVSVEEFAYLLFGALALVGPTRFRKVLWVIAAGALILRIGSITAFGFEPITLYYFAPGRIDAIAFGGLFAVLSPALSSRKLPGVWLVWLVVACLLALLAGYGRGSFFVATFGYSLLAISAAILVLCIALAPRRRSHAVTRALARLGLVSYFVYLFHQFVIAAFQMSIPASWYPHLNLWVLSLVVVLVSYALALVSWKWFEYPLIALGRRMALVREARNPCA